MITHIKWNDQDSLGLLVISQNVKLNGMGQQDSKGHSVFLLMHRDGMAQSQLNMSQITNTYDE